MTTVFSQTVSSIRRPSSVQYATPTEMFVPQSNCSNIDSESRRHECRSMNARANLGQRGSRCLSICTLLCIRFPFIGPKGRLPPTFVALIIGQISHQGNGKHSASYPHAPLTAVEFTTDERTTTIPGSIYSTIRQMNGVWSRMPPSSC
eukprot:scaffold260591_cov26-Prasinocladus_malaysianus.AAC.2